MSSDYTKLVESYFEWLRNRTELSLIQSVGEITTPFLDRHNDRIQIYVQAKGPGTYRLHDAGYILNDLEMSGCGLSTEHRLQMLDVILKGYGVRLENDELTVDATRESFPQRKHALLQAMLNVSDMYLTSKQNVARFFVEDVTSFLEQHEIRYLAQAAFIGKSGLHHRFDFSIPGSRKQPDRFLKALNYPNQEAARNLLFAWTDTDQNRSANSVMYAVINDSERSISDDVMHAFDSYGIRTILWSRREQYVLELAA